MSLVDQNDLIIDNFTADYNSLSNINAYQQLNFDSNNLIKILVKNLKIN